MLTPLVTALMVANAGMFLLQRLFDPAFTNALALVPAAVLFRPWTPFTYMFLHGGLSHLFFNMLALYFAGPPVEMRLGGRRFLGLYLTAGLFGAILSIMTPYSAVVGASGAIFGVLFAFARYWPHAQILIWGIFPIEARVLVVVLTVMSLFFGFQGGGSVAHFAHLGGFVGGWLFLRLAERHSSAAAFKSRAAPAPQRTADDRDLARWRQIRSDQMHPLNREELNRILDKISSTGLGSLSAQERAFLERFSQTH
jgi:membrane associated rhomboid family serine protease